LTLKPERPLPQVRVIPPDKQGRVGKDIDREDPESSGGDEKPVINKDLSITYKGKTYRWNQAKPISKIKKALGDEEWDNYVNAVKKKQKKLSESLGFSYRDFFQF
jgi:hypothetical protein